MAAIEKTNLCFNGFRLFKANWREWLKSSVLFFITLTILGCFAYDPAVIEAFDKLHEMQAQPHLTQEQLDILQKVRDARKNNEQLTQEQISAVNQIQQQMNDQMKENKEQLHVIWQMMVPKTWTFPLILLSILIQFFVYNVLFLKSPPTFDAPELKASRFFYFLWKILQKFLVLFAIIVVVAGITTGAGFMNTKMKLGMGFVPIALGCAGVLFIYYTLIKYILVAPLAISGTGPALITSWRMTKGSWWRIFGNIFLAGICVFVFIVLIQFIEKGITSFLMTSMPSVFGTVTASQPEKFSLLSMIGFFSVIPHHIQNGIAAYVGIVFLSLNACILYGFSAAFYCATVRTLRQEQQ